MDKSFVYEPFGMSVHDWCAIRWSAYATRNSRHRVHTSRKNRRPRIPRPASNQSMTGSAYSCIEAVKMTRVYQADT